MLPKTSLRVAARPGHRHAGLRSQVSWDLWLPVPAGSPLLRSRVARQSLKPAPRPPLPPRRLPASWSGRVSASSAEGAGRRARGCGSARVRSLRFPLPRAQHLRVDRCDRRNLRSFRHLSMASVATKSILAVPTGTVSSATSAAEVSSTTRVVIPTKTTATTTSEVSRSSPTPLAGRSAGHLSLRLGFPSFTAVAVHGTAFLSA